MIIDFFANRKPFSIEAALLFNYSFNKKINIYISAVSYNNIYFILRQSCSHTETIKMLTELNEWTDTVEVSKDIINKSLKSNFKDIEDAIQYNCAKSLKKLTSLLHVIRKTLKQVQYQYLHPTKPLL